LQAPHSLRRSRWRGQPIETRPHIPNRTGAKRQDSEGPYPHERPDSRTVAVDLVIQPRRVSPEMSAIPAGEEQASAGMVAVTARFARRSESVRLASAFEHLRAVRRRERAPALHTLRKDRRRNASKWVGGFREASGVRPARQRFRPTFADAIPQKVPTKEVAGPGQRTL
jgi:hypothetical protein